MLPARRREIRIGESARRNRDQMGSGAGLPVNGVAALRAEIERKRPARFTGTRKYRAPALDANLFPREKRGDPEGAAGAALTVAAMTKRDGRRFTPAFDAEAAADAGGGAQYRIVVHGNLRARRLDPRCLEPYRFGSLRSSWFGDTINSLRSTASALARAVHVRDELRQHEHQQQPGTRVIICRCILPCRHKEPFHQGH